MQFANRFKYMVSHTASYTEPTFSSKRQWVPRHPPQISPISRPLQALDQVSVAVGKNLLLLACRHHIDEIILEKIFLVIMGPSSGPDTGLFKRFKSHWHQMSMVKYKPGINDADVARDLSNMTGNIIEFCLQQLEEVQPIGRITRSCWNLPSFSLGEFQLQGFTLPNQGQCIVPALWHD